MKLFPAGGDVGFVRDGLDRADRFARTAVDAFVGVDVERPCPFVDAVDRTFLDASSVHHVDTWCSDHVRHEWPPGHCLIFEDIFPLKSYSMAIRKGTGSARAGTHAVLASRRRVQLLDALRAGAESMTAAELADLCDLHVTTVRFHLNALIEVGLIAKETEHNVTRGRPRQLYRAQNALGSGVGATSGYEKWLTFWRPTSHARATAPGEPRRGCGQTVGTR